MNDLTIYFVGKDNFTINGLPRFEAERLMEGLTAGPGHTTINGSDGTITLINREHFTFATYSEASK